MNYNIVSQQQMFEFTSIYSDTSYLKLELKPCQIYEWRVRAICANGATSAWSESRKFETKGCSTGCSLPFGLVHDLVATDINNQTAYLNWKSDLITLVPEKYELEYRLPNVSGSSWMSDSITGNSHKINVRSCQVYEWRVRKVCGNSLKSEWAYGKFETKCNTTPTCPLPAMPKVTATTTGGVSLLWDIRLTDTLVIEYAPAGDSLFKSLIVLPTPNGVVLRELKPCTEYKLRIRVKCANGAINWATTSFKVPGANCLKDNGIDGATQGLRVNNTLVKGVAISPNPGRDFVQVQYELEESSEVNISLMNLQGQVVNQFNGGRQDAGVYMQTLDNVSELTTGLYMVVIRANGKIAVSQKWLKQ